MSKKLKKLPNLLNKSPWLWRSCTQSRTLSFRTINFNSAYEEENEEFQGSDMSADDEQIEALVKGLSLMPGKRLFLDLDDTNSIATPPETAAGRWQVPFKESVAMAMDSKEPYLDFKKSMEEMIEAHGLTKDWKGMELLLSWYLKSNGKQNHDFIIGAFVDLLVGDNFANSNSNYPSTTSCCCFLCINSTSSSSSSIMCSSSSSFVSSSSCSSSFRGSANCIVSSSNVVEVMEYIVESECSTFNCLSSLYENEEDI